MLYKPREDSHLLVKHVAKLASGRVLDIGTGSGIQAIAAARSRKVKSVLAVDIQEEIVQHCRDNIKIKKISFKQSDLFENVPEKPGFDTIIFNPPYLPEDVTLKDITVEGGKKGYETLERFFDRVNLYLKPEGIILVVFSSLTDKSKVNGFIEKNLLEFREIEEQKLFYEQLYVYLARKSAFLRQMEKKRITGLKKLTKGHRGLIFTGKLGSKKIAVKLQRKDIAAKGTVNHEAKILKLLNKCKIGPKLLFSGKDFFVYEFAEGIFIPEFLEKAKKKEIINILTDVFRQCFILDQLKINKEEMQHPYKHIVIGSEGKKEKIKAVLLDFERAKKAKKSQDVTQFCQYVTSGTFRHLVNGKIRMDKEKLRKLAGIYKKNPSKGNFEQILKQVYKA